MKTNVEQGTSYYGNPDVRARIIEFLGGDAQSSPTCCYLVAGDVRRVQLHDHYGVQALDSLFGAGVEICRSLWDETSLLADFDIEYVNFDHAAEAFLEPKRIFQAQESVADTIGQLLQE